MVLCSAALDAELCGKSECAHAVDQAEVHRLDVAALLRRHLVDRHAENFSRVRAVDIRTFGEGFEQRGIPGQMRHDPQLDLRIVGRYQHVARRRDERLANPPSFSGTHRNILQIRVGAREPARNSSCLAKFVHPAGARIHHLRQLVGVGRLELGQTAMLEQELGQRVVRRELLQRLRRSMAAPLQFFFTTGSFMRSNRISPSCFGDPG